MRPTTPAQIKAYHIFVLEINDIHDLYVKHDGRTQRFRECTYLGDAEKAALAAMYEPRPYVRRNFRDCFDRAQAAGRALLAAMGEAV